MDKYEMEITIKSIQDALRKNGVTEYTSGPGHDIEIHELRMLVYSLGAELGYEYIPGPAFRKVYKK